MAFKRPSGTRIGHNHPVPSDESLGYFPSFLRNEDRGNASVCGGR